MTTDLHTTAYHTWMLVVGPGNTRRGGGSLAKQKLTPEENRCVPPPPPTTSIHLFDHLKGEGNDWSIECNREINLFHYLNTATTSSTAISQFSVSSVLCAGQWKTSLNVVKFIDFDSLRSRLWRIITGRLGSPRVVRGPELGVGHPVPHLRPRVAPGEGVAQSVRAWVESI